MRVSINPMHSVPTVMRSYLLTLVLVLISVTAYSQTITIGENGIVRCKDVAIGTTGTIFGDTYEVVDRNLLIQRRNEGKDLTKVCVSNVTDMNRMFRGTVSEPSQFNQSIEKWDVSSVTDMNAMFSGSQFNQPINFWCVQNITSEPGNFSTNSPLSQSNKPTWGTCVKPEKLTQLQPQNNSTDVLRNVELGWNSDSLSTHYQIQVFEGSNPTVIDTLVSDTTYIHAYPFKDNFLYNWRVRAVNNELKPIRFGDWSSVWKFTTILDTSIESEEQPTEFSFDQNYPNPFNPTTQIRFALPESQQVTIQVYDINGRLVAELLNNVTYSAGNHQLTFDGAGLSSGIYLYTMRTGSGMSFTRKLLLLK